MPENGALKIWNGILNQWVYVNDGRDPNEFDIEVRATAAPLDVQSTAPTPVRFGHLWVDSDTYILSYWDGTFWQPIPAGIGSLGTQSAAAVAITGGAISGTSLTSASVNFSGGNISGITDLAIADGGTGASTVASALGNLNTTAFTASDSAPTPLMTGHLWWDSDDPADSIPDTDINYSRLQYGTVLTPGMVWTFVGDSITSYSVGDGIFPHSYMGQTLQMVGALVASMQSIEAGVPSETTQDMVTRLPTIMTQSFRGSVLMAGTNDVGDYPDLTTTVLNLTTLINTLRTRGPVVLCTIPPRGYTTPTYDVPDAEQWNIDGINSWIRTFGPQLGCEIADGFSVIVDTLDGSNVSAWNYGDSIHPGAKGNCLIAMEISKAILRVTNTPKPNGLIVSDSVSCLTPDPLCVGGTTLPASWAERAGGTGTAPTYSLVADVTDFLPKRVDSTTGIFGAGRWAQMAWTATSGGTREIECSIDSAHWAVGDSVALCGHIQIEDVSGANKWWLDVVNSVAEVTISIIDQASVNISGVPLDRCPGVPNTGNTVYNLGPIVWPFAIPPGTTSMKLVVSVKLPSGSTRNIRVGNIGLLNLTKMFLQDTIGAWTNTTVRT